MLRRGGGCGAPGDTGSTATDSNPFSLTYLYEINTIDDNIMYEMKFFYNCNNLFRKFFFYNYIIPCTYLVLFENNILFHASISTIIDTINKSKHSETYTLAIFTRIERKSG